MSLEKVEGLLKNRPMLKIRPDGTTDEETLRNYLFKLRDFWQELEVAVAETKKQLQDLVNELIQRFPTEDKILRYDEETQESWIVITADPEQWRRFPEFFDDWLQRVKKNLGKSKK